MKEQSIKSGDAPGASEEVLLEWIDERFLKSFARIQCLSLIAKGHVHGYDIIKFFEKTYNVKISAGKIYPILQWLEDNRYINGKWEYTEGKPGKKIYELTPKGCSFLLDVKGRLLLLVENICSDGAEDIIIASH